MRTIVNRFGLVGVRCGLAAAAAGAALLAGPAASGQVLREIATGMTYPLDLAADPSHPERLYIADQEGQLWVYQDGELLDEPVLEVDRGDFSGRSDANEQGLLGVALEPGFGETNLNVYLYYTDGDGTTVLSRFPLEEPTEGDWDDEERLLEIEQPYWNHNGGCIRFGPDGLLYVGPGDGGAANDPHNYSQRLDTMLGKLLRIDVTGEPDRGKAYAVPASNPFVGREGALPEIWAYGLRNPWKFEFDSRGRLWIADVGQNRFEWVHVQPEGSAGGENYGWKVLEGLGEFEQGGRPPHPPRMSRAEIAARGMQPAVWEYDHGDGLSITGGFFYEGSRYPWLRNRYICADYVWGGVWSFRAVEEREGERAWYRADDVVNHESELERTFGTGGRRKTLDGAIASFGRSADGETVYILDHAGGRLVELVD